MKNKIFVYKTINNINGMIYIGVHKCRHSGNCDYLGSGKILRRAIKKYGKENFSRTILFFFNSLDEAFKKEKELVSVEFINDEMTYNIVEGGKWGRLSDEIEALRKLKISNSLKGRIMSKESIEKIRDSLTGNKLSESTKLKISNKLKNRKLSESHIENIRKNTHFRKMSKESHEKTNMKNRGSKRSEETKQKMREAWVLRKMKNDNN